MAGSDRAVNRTGGDRDKSLETALAQIERQFGRGSIMRLGDEARAPMEVIPTGSIATFPPRLRPITKFSRDCLKPRETLL